MGLTPQQGQRWDRGDSWAVLQEVIAERDQSDAVRRILITALTQIANMDYRGNRSTETVIATEVLKRAQELYK